MAIREATPPKPVPTPAEVLAKHSKRKISDYEQRRLYELEMQGKKPLLSQRAYG